MQCATKLTATVSATTLIAVLAAGTAFAQSAEDIVFPIGEDPRFSWGDLERFEQLDLSGQEINVLGPWSGTEGDAVNSVLATFEAATGAEVIYTGSGSMEQQIMIDFQAGSPPDVTAFPQPGLASDLASQGGLAPLGDEMADWVTENYAAGSSWVDLATFPDESGEPQFFGLFYKIDLKSLVWYSPDNLEDAGYDVPATMEELLEVSAALVEDGETPWCIGLGSGDATGWPATDWVEDIMLRIHTPDVYDGWVTNEIPFNDPRIIEAIDTFGSFARNPDWVDGGVEAVGAGDFRDSALGLFSVPPKCYFHRQASFIPAFFPDDVELGLDADFFYFPSYESKELGNPILGAGSLWAITKDGEASRALIDFLTTALAHELWMANSSFLTAHKGANLDTYFNDTLRKQGEIILDATVFRFDASDLMPGAIGAGSFWTGMIDYVGGKDAGEVTSAIQENWDAIK